MLDEEGNDVADGVISGVDSVCRLAAALLLLLLLLLLLPNQRLNQDEPDSAACTASDGDDRDSGADAAELLLALYPMESVAFCGVAAAALPVGGRFLGLYASNTSL